MRLISKLAVRSVMLFLLIYTNITYASGTRHDASLGVNLANINDDENESYNFKYKYKYKILELETNQFFYSSSTVDETTSRLFNSDFEITLGNKENYFIFDTSYKRDKFSDFQREFIYSFGVGEKISIFYIEANLGQLFSENEGEALLGQATAVYKYKFNKVFSTKNKISHAIAGSTKITSLDINLTTQIHEQLYYTTELKIDREEDKNNKDRKKYLILNFTYKF